MYQIEEDSEYICIRILSVCCLGSVFSEVRKLVHNAPVFVVGLPRSGTTLLAGILGSHPNIYCGPETQFYNKIGLRLLYRFNNLFVPKWLVRSRLEGLQIANQSVLSLYGVSADEILVQPLITSNRGALLSAIVGSKTARSGKLRWAEKTPNHLLHLDEIRADFPESPVVRIVRDPRDAAISMTKLPWASDDPVVNARLCSHWLDKSKRFFERDGNCMTIFYRDLVTDPGLVLRSVFDFLGEEYFYDHSALSNGTDVQTDNEPWKKDVSNSIHTGSLNKYRSLEPRTRVQLDHVLSYWLTYFNLDK